MTTRIQSYENFDIAVRDLANQGYQSKGQDGMLGYLYTKNTDDFRLVKNDFTGRYDFTALDY